MEAFFTIINVVVLIIFIIMLNIMARKHVSFPKRVFTALGIGIVLGIALHLIFGAESKVLKQSTDWFSIVGDGYVALLQMIVMPLIFVSIVAAFSKIQIGDKFAKIGTFIFMFLIGTVAIAAIVGIIYALIFGLDASSIDLGSAEHSRGTEISKQAKDLTKSG